jgi:hypothetical protein
MTTLKHPKSKVDKPVFQTLSLGSVQVSELVFSPPGCSQGTLLFALYEDETLQILQPDGALRETISNVTAGALIAYVANCYTS